MASYPGSKSWRVTILCQRAVMALAACLALGQAGAQNITTPAPLLRGVTVTDDHDIRDSVSITLGTKVADQNTKSNTYLGWVTAGLEGLPNLTPDARIPCRCARIGSRTAIGGPEAARWIGVRASRARETACRLPRGLPCRRDPSTSAIRARKSTLCVAPGVPGRWVTASIVLIEGLRLDRELALSIPREPGEDAGARLPAPALPVSPS